MAKFLDRLFELFIPGAAEPQPPIVAPTVRNTIFSTGPSGRRRNRLKHLRDQMELNQRLSEVLGMSFQRGIESLRPQFADGSAAEGYALDEQYSDLTAAKLTNARGGYMPMPQVEWYASQAFIGYHMCAILSQNWLVDKVCGVPAADAVRHGYEVMSNDGEPLDPKILNAIRIADRRMNIKGQAREFIKKSRIFGIRHALFLIDGINYEAPFNPDGIKPGSYRGISQIDPMWLSPVLDEAAASLPMSPSFYEPTWYQIQGRRIHKSHFIITRCGDDVPDLLKPSYYYGGIPLPQKLYNRIYAAERTADEAPMLAMSKRMLTLQTDTTKWMGPDSDALEKIQEWMELQNNYSVKVIGDEDEVHQFETSLQSLDETIMTQYQLVAAAANMPITKLMGTAPKGMDATGEYDEANYHEELESIQENSATPLVERHHLCLWRSNVAPAFNENPKRGLEIAWRPVDSMTAKEQAEVNQVKATTAAQLVGIGALDGLDVRRNLIADPDSGYTGIEEVVPDGPGDRDAAAEEKKAMLESKTKGEESDAKDEAIAAGILYRAGSKFLLVKRRSDRVRMPNMWSIPAGMIEGGETPMQAACREFKEEMGRTIHRAAFAWSDESFAMFIVDGEEFVPTLDDEHSAYGWFLPSEVPHPLHPKLAEQIEAATGEVVAQAPFESSAMDDRWITVHPNGDDSEGRPVLIDEGGHVVAGMGGKFNGKKIDDLHGKTEGSSTKEAETPAAKERPHTKHANALSEKATTREEHLEAMSAHVTAAEAAKNEGDEEGRKAHVAKYFEHYGKARELEEQARKAKAAEQSAKKRALNKAAKADWKGRDFSAHEPGAIHAELHSEFGVGFVNGTTAERDRRDAWKKYTTTRNDDDLKAYREATNTTLSHPSARIKGHTSVDITKDGAAAKQQRALASRVHSALSSLAEQGYDLREATKDATVSMIAGNTGKAAGHAFQRQGHGYFAISASKNSAAEHQAQQAQAQRRAESNRPIWTVSTRPGATAEEAARAVIVHEFAHALGLQKHIQSPHKLARILHEKISPNVGEQTKWIKENISEYAAANIHETDAELATLVTSPHYVKGMLPAEFENHVYDLFKKKDR